MLCEVSLSNDGAHDCTGTKKCATYNCCREPLEGKIRCKRHAGSFISKRICKTEGCNKLDVGGGRCRGHGGGPRCSTEGCTRASAGKGYCINHGGGRRCQAPHCNRSVQGGGSLCKNHGGGMRCAQPDCSRSAQGNSRNCIKHGGGTRCVYENCKRLVRRKGFCQEHSNMSKSTAPDGFDQAFTKPLLETLKICPQNPLMILCGMTQLEDHKEILKGETKLFPQNCIDLLVPGMMCEENCASAVTKFLKAIVGVRDVKVDFPRRLVSIQVLPEFIPLLSIEYCIKALKSIGFQAESCAVLREKFLQQEYELELPPVDPPNPLRWNGSFPLQHNMSVGAFETIYTGCSTVLGSFCSCGRGYTRADCSVHGMFSPGMKYFPAQYQEYCSLPSTFESISEGTNPTNNEKCVPSSELQKGCTPFFGGSCSYYPTPR